LYPIPDFFAGVFHGHQQLRLLGDEAKVIDEVRADLALLQMLFLFRVPTFIDDEGKVSLKLSTVHLFSPESSASGSHARSFRRGLLSCLKPLNR
jgi:hypothetical protein